MSTDPLTTSGEQPTGQAQASDANISPVQQPVEAKQDGPSLLDAAAAWVTDGQPEQAKPADAAPQNVTDPAAASEQNAQVAVELPQNWPAETREVVSKLPPEAQTAFLEQSKHLEAGYTRKFQELSQQAKALEPLRGLAQALNSDPGLAQAIDGYFQGKQAPQQQAQAQPPEDPVKRVQWEIEQLAMAKVNEQLAPLQQQLQAMQEQYAIQQTLAEIATDPLREQVYTHIEALIAMQPSFSRQEFKARLHRDPAAFREVYGDIRAALAAQQQATNTNQAQPANQQQAQPQQARDQATGQFVAKRTVAPALESGGRPDTTSASAQVAKIAQKINAGLGDEDTFGSLLAAKGVFDRMARR